MKLKLTTEQGVELTAEISEEEYKKIDNTSKRWKPKYDEEYWFIDDVGDINFRFWIDGNIGNFRYNTFNCFETEADAQLWLEMISAERYVPEEGEGWFCWNFLAENATPFVVKDIPEYIYIGNCHRTKKEAKEWGKKYGDLINKYIG